MNGLHNIGITLMLRTIRKIYKGHTSDGTGHRIVVAPAMNIPTRAGILRPTLSISAPTNTADRIPATSAAAPRFAIVVPYSSVVISCLSSKR